MHDRDCVVDITNDIEKFRIKMKKTVDKKYSSLVDDNVDKLISNILKDHINNEVDYDNMMDNPDFESKKNKKESKLVLGYETNQDHQQDRFEPNLFNWWQTQKIITQQSKKSSKKNKKSQKRKGNLKTKSIKKSKSKKKSKTKK